MWYRKEKFLTEFTGKIVVVIARPARQAVAILYVMFWKEVIV